MSKLPICEAADFINGRAFKPSEWGTEGLPIIRIQNLTGSNETFNFFSGTVDPRNVVKRGDILISWSASLGVYRWTRNDAALNQHIFKVVLKPGVVPGYFYYVATNALNQMVAQVHGSTMQHITKDKFDGIPIFLPIESEQKRIASILEKADRLRRTRRYASQLGDTFLQSIFLELFGDPRANEKGWNKVPLGSLVYDIRGGASLGPDDFLESGFPVLHKGAIKPNGEVSLDSKKKTFAPAEFANANRRCQVNREFIAVTLRDLVPTGPTIGLAADLRNGPFDEYLLAQGAYAFRLTPDKTVPEYFVQLSNMPNFRHVLRQNAVGSTQIHIRRPIYLAISIPLPGIELQHEFAAIVRRFERLRAQQREAERQAEHLFQTLLHKAFEAQL